MEFPLAIDEQIVKMFELFYPENTDMSGDFLSGVREAFPNVCTCHCLPRDILIDVWSLMFV